MVTFWEGWALSKGQLHILSCSLTSWNTDALRSDPENLLVMLQTWQSGDISQQEPYKGDFELALRSIKAKTLVLPGKTDLYFP